jgi:iron(III) transport system substrate-binding protein
METKDGIGPMNRNVKRSFGLGAGLAACLVIAACGSSGSSSSGSAGTGAGSASAAAAVGGSPALSALYAKAKSEGSVTWAWPYDQSQAQPIIDAFEKAYPGIAVNYTDVKPNSLLTQIQLQVKSGKVTQDIAPANVTSVAPTIKDDVAQTGIDWASLGVNSTDVFQTNLVSEFSELSVIFYNKNSVSADQVPKTWNDLLNPQFSGKIAVDGRASSWMSIFFIDNKTLGGATGGLAYAKKFAAQKPSFQTSTESIVPVVSSGQFSLGTGLLNQVMAAQAKGAPLGIAPVSPVHAESTYGFVVKGAPHPAAAELLLAWLDSKAGQQASDAAYSTTIPPSTQCPPGNSTQQWKAACDASLKWESLSQLSEFKAQSQFNTKVQKLWGTYTGTGGGSS